MKVLDYSNDYSRIKKINKKIITIIVLLVFSLLIYNIIAILFFDIEYAQNIRTSIEKHINNSIYVLSKKVKDNKLSELDYFKIHSIAVGGIIVGYIQYPEAGKIFKHCIYGDGTPLKVSGKYFKNSRYVKSQINKLGIGTHGPLKVKQYQDWRLSLAFNPYYLKISKDKIRIYYPKTQFIKSHKIYTIVPVGKFKFKIYDNIFTAIQSKPFYSYAEWEQ